MSSGFTTTILHSDLEAPIEHNAVHKPMHTAVAFGYEDSRELARVFKGEAAGYAYGRQGNPTTAALESKVTKMEDGVATACFATGMAAIASMCVALLRAGDHVVSRSFLFGNTNSLFGTFNTWGCDISFVDATDVANVERAQMMIESSSRPALQRFLTETREIWLDLAQKNRRSGLIRWAVDVDPLAI